LSDVQEPGGVLAMMDFVRGRSAFAPLFAVTMLLHTESGNTYAIEDYRDWLSSGRYGAVEVADVDEERQLVSGVSGARP
jgi:hypothetical protein